MLIIKAFGGSGEMIVMGKGGGRREYSGMKERRGRGRIVITRACTGNHI